jgi:hypothetical protein
MKVHFIAWRKALEPEALELVNQAGAEIHGDYKN